MEVSRIQMPLVVPDDGRLRFVDGGRELARVDAQGRITYTEGVTPEQVLLALIEQLRQK